MNCDPILDMKLEQDKLKAMFPHVSASTLKRNPSFAANCAITEMIQREHGVLTEKPRSKYRNVKVEYEGMMFDSGHELKCWKNLKLRYRAREIFMLERQVSYDLIVSGTKIGRFTADFRWFENDQEVIADAKSEITRKETAYRLRKRIFEAQYAPLVIVEL